MRPLPVQLSIPLFVLALPAGCVAEEAPAATLGQLSEGTVPPSGGDHGGRPAALPFAPPPSSLVPYFASVRAGGTGCPKGSSNVSISEDGKRLVARFAAFEVNVGAEKSVDVKDCSLTFTLHDPIGLMFRVIAVGIQGEAFFEPGVSAQVHVRVVPFGRPPLLDETYGPLHGPLDETHVALVRPREQAGWTPCQKSQTFSLGYALSLRNDEQKRTGYFRVDFEDLEPIELEVRWCRAI